MEIATSQKVPGLVAGGIHRYADFGILPGSMLRALIRGDADQAWACADSDSRANFDAIKRMVDDVIPAVARGSSAAMDRWMRQRGRLQGC